MPKVAKEIQLNIIVPNDVGVGAKVFGAIGKAGIYIRAFCAYGADKQANFILLTNEPEKAAESLKKSGYPVTTDEVVVVQIEDKVGRANEITEELAKAGINIEFCYATAADPGSKEATAVFKTTDNDKAIKVITKMM
ncbi:MAG: hypothetical protein KAI63_03720 [Planctomycetes bacterium]|nr:hypothetical protein [Planctomycetota bacterium]